MPAGRPRNEKMIAKLSKLWLSGASIEKIAEVAELKNVHVAYKRINTLRKIDATMFPRRLPGRKAD